MATVDPAEPNPLSGLSGSATGSSASPKKTPIAGAAKVGAKVSIAGLLSVNNELRTMLTLLQQVRTALGAVNTAAAGFPSSLGGGSSPLAAAGVGVGASSPSLSRFSAMTTGFTAMPRTSQVAFVGSYVLGAAARGVGGLTGRFNQQLAESTPISQGNAFVASQYGVNYGQMERARISALGNFVTSRQEAFAAQVTGLGYGQSIGQTQNFLRSVVAPMVMASGGTLTDNQAAQRAGQFLDPLVQRRASQLGIGLGRVGGQVQNTQNVAMGYIRDYEKRFGFKFNEIDFQNMQSAGSATRYAFKRLYSLSDDAVDTIVQSGMQSLQYSAKTGGGTLDFSNTDQLSKILSPNTLGLRALKLQTAQARRNANYFANQEGSMVGKVNTDISIENALGATEDAFSNVIGIMGEFQKAIKGAISVLQMMGGAAMLFGGMSALGGGGGGGGGLGAALGGTLGGSGGGTLKTLGLITAGVGIGFAGYKMARGGNALGLLAGAGGGALAGGAAFGLPGAIGGAVLGAGAAGWGYLKSRHTKDINNARQLASTMSDAELMSRIGAKGRLIGDQGSPGPFVTAATDIMQQRRAYLVYSLLQDALGAGEFGGLSSKDALELSDVMSFFSDGDTSKDDKFTNSAKKAMKYLQMVMRDKPSIYKQYLGGLTDPFAFADPNTSISKSLVESTSSILSGKNVGDPITGKGASGPTWDNLDSSFKSQLSQLLQAGGGQVWLGNGWRSHEQQKTLFLSRHHVDPNGDISYNGQKWSLNQGESPAAPPYNSWHEEGKAADLEGPGVTNGWLAANAGKFGLRTFGSVNGEPWHVQPSNIPGSPSDSGSSGGAPSTSSSSVGTSPISAASPAAGTFKTALSNGSVPFLTGNNISVASGSGVLAATAASTTSGSSGSSYSGSGPMSAQQIAQVAYNAGFRGKDLVSMVAIAMRESHGNPSAFNGNKGTGDQSYGLWQINMLGDMGKQRATALGITDYNALLDPAMNAKAAFQLYQATGLRPWGGYKGMDPLTGTSSYMNDAANAVSSLPGGGMGDPVSGGGSGGGITIKQMTVQMVATGKVDYDAQQFINAVKAKASSASGEVSLRRSS